VGLEEVIMVSFHHTETVNASPEQIFQVYADVAGWKTWDPEVEWSTLDGAFATGSKGRLKPKGGPASSIRLLRVEDSTSFSVEARLPLCQMLFEHELTSDGGKTDVLHRVTFEGPLSLLFGWLIGRQIENGFPGTLSGLKRKCEAVASPQQGGAVDAATMQAGH
jgi:ligand-binding SRPBCC domain-containing protein